MMRPWTKHRVHDIQDFEHLVYYCIVGIVWAHLWLILLLIGTGMFTFICMLALGATAWLNAAARRRPAARAVSTYIELIGTVIISIG